MEGIFKKPKTMEEHVESLVEIHYEDTICQKECLEFANKKGDKLNILVDEAICLHVFH